MGTGLFSIGVSGLQVAQAGLLTTQHNIANASTPGYSRQEALQATNVPLMTSAGAVGQGVRIDTVKRSYDRFLSEQFNGTQAKVSELNAYYDKISRIDNMLTDPTTGLSPALQDFFQGVQSVAANPSLLSARQSMVSSAESLAARFNNFDQRFSELSTEVNGRISDTAKNINVYATQIAELNQRITISEAAYGQPPNDLLDKRDQLLNDLSKLIKVSTTNSGDGSINVFIGSGQQLVVGSAAMTMTAVGSTTDPRRMVIGLKIGDTTQVIPESLITGGELGGLVHFRSDVLDKAVNQLGQVAASVALTFNAQHSLGQDLLGNVAGGTGFVSNFFKVPTPDVVADTLNSGTGNVTAVLAAPSGNFLTNLKGSSYQLQFGASGSYTVTRLSDGVAVATGSGAGVASFDGLNMNIGAVGNNGDIFTLAGTSVAANPLNTGSANVATSLVPSAANPYTNLKPSDYQVQFGSGSTYTITRLSDNQVVASGTGTGVVNFDGLDVTIGGVGNNGDRFKISPFKDAASQIDVDARVKADPRLLAAAAPVVTSASPSNQGGASLSQGTVGQGYTVPSPPLTLTATATQLVNFPAGKVTALYSDGTALPDSAATGTISLTNGSATLTGFAFNGMVFDVKGKPAAGDTFTIGPNVNGVQDSRNVLLMGKLQTENTVAGGTATYQTAYAQLVADNGTRTRDTKILADTQQNVLEQVQASRESLSGVNLDEEAARLLQYQQAYQASSKVLQIAGTLFDTLLSIGR